MGRLTLILRCKWPHSGDGITHCNNPSEQHHVDYSFKLVIDSYQTATPGVYVTPIKELVSLSAGLNNRFEHNSCDTTDCSYRAA